MRSWRGFRAFLSVVLSVSLIRSLMVLLFCFSHLFMASLVGFMFWLCVRLISFARCSSMFPFGLRPVSVR